MCHVVGLTRPSTPISSAGCFCGGVIIPAIGPKVRSRLLQSGWYEQVPLDPDVEQLRVGALLWLAHRDLLLRDDTADLTGRIIEVAWNNRARRADDHARRFEVLFHSVRAVMALGCGVGVRIDIKRVVGTRLHASLAADAAVVIKIDNAVKAPVQCARRANLNAGSAVTVIAAENAKVPAGMGKLAFLDVLHPGSKHTHWNLVFLLAGYGAGVTTDAAVLVDDKAVTHEN